MHLVGATPRAGVGLDPEPGLVYHVTRELGPLPGQRNFRRVKYGQVYPGIDAIYHGDRGDLEFDFVVEPHADPSRIRLALSGAEKINLTSAGDLALQAGDEQIRLNKPVAYQEVHGVRRDVAATFVVHPDSTARIALAPYDRSLPLVIDPTITFATYFGSDLDDSIRALETDASGNVYMFGTVPDAINFISTPPTSFFGPSPVVNPVNDCYVGKLAPGVNFGSVFSWLALIHDSASCEAMTVSPGGDVYVARTGINGRTIVDRLSDSGGGLSLVTRLDVPQLASASHLRVNSDEHLYVIGGCALEDFPGELWPLPGGFQPGPAGLPSQCDPNTGPNAVNSQHLLVVYDVLGNLLYGSFFGFASGQIEPTSFEVDLNTRRAFIAGHTLVGPGSTLITTPNAFQQQQGDSNCADPNLPPCGWGDAFLIVANPALPDADSLEYASYLGGEGSESDVAMSVGGDGLVHIVGNTQSIATFPGMPLNATGTIFRAVLDLTRPPANQLVAASPVVASPLTRLLYTHQAGTRFRLFPDGKMGLLAFTEDPAFEFAYPLFSGPRDPNAVADNKPLLIVHDPVDEIVFASYLDDASLAHHPHIAVDPNGVLYAAVQTKEFGRSTDGTSPLGRDVLLFGIEGIGAPPPNSPPIADAGADQTYVSSSLLGTRVLLYSGLSFDPNGDPLTYTWLEGSNVLDSRMGTLVELVFTPGQHVLTLTVDDGRGGVASDTMILTIVPNTSAGGPQTVTPADSAWNNSSSYLESPVTVRFANVTSTGFTSLTTRYMVTPVPPPGMQFGSPPLHYDLATTAAFTGNLDVCVDYRGQSFARPDADLRIYQQVNGTWDVLPQTNDTGARSICGTTATLGTFALFTPAVAANEISLLAGQPLLTACTKNQGIDPNEGGFAPDSALCNTRGLAYDAGRNYLYFAEAGQADAVRRIDLTTGRITTVAGTGFLTGSLDGSGGDLRDDDKNNVDPLTAPINQVLRLALDAQGNLILAEFGTGRLRKVDFAQNRIYTIADVSAVTLPSALTVDASGAALFSSFAFGDSVIWRLTPGADGVLDGSPDEVLSVVAGNGVNGFDPSLIPPGGIDPLLIPIAPDDLAFGPDGSLYVTGSNGVASVLRITPGADGLVNGVGDTAFLIAGGFSQAPHFGDGTPAAASRLFIPISMTVAPNGDVYVGDTGNPWGATVRKITAVDGVVTGAPDEIITTVAGFHIYDPAFSSGTDLPFSHGDGHALSSIFGANFDLLVLPNGDLVVNDFWQVRRIGPRVADGDSTPPVLTLPSPIVVEAESPAGTVVTFSATAFDTVDGSVAVSCSPLSGSLFGLAAPGPTTTTVTCSSNDTAGNTATGTFTVIVQDTTPPAVTAPAPIVVAATEATGARANVPQAPDTGALLAFLAAGFATDVADPNPQRLAAQRVDCGQPSTVLEPVTAATLFTVGQNCVDVAFTDASGNIGRTAAMFDVSPPIGGHVNVAGVPVVATDLFNTPQPVTATFVLLQQPGLLRAFPMEPPAAPPAGLMFPGIAYDVTTTALAPSAIAVCLTQAPPLPPVMAGDRLLLFENGTWLDRTASVDITASQICGLPTSLGVYAIARQAVVTVDILETINVTDAPVALLSAMVGVTEQIVVSDAPTVTPPLLIAINEQILVNDAPGLSPSIIVGITEQIAVVESPAATPVVFPAVISGLSPSTAVVGGAAIDVVVTGSGFAAGAVAAWNGLPRVTVVGSSTVLTVSLLAGDLATGVDIATALITVTNPGTAPSNTLPFVVLSPRVVTMNAQIALPGGTATASNAPTVATTHGVSATLTNNNPASAPAVVVVASYATNPVEGTIFAAGAFFDVQVIGADASDSLTANFYYPSDVTALAEPRLRLQYWNGTAWASVISSGGTPPLKDTTDNLDATISGGRFTATFDATSTPPITALGGTVFAVIEERDEVAPITTFGQSPAANAEGWNNTSVTVTLTATDDHSGVSRTEWSLNGSVWRRYASAIRLENEGIYVIRFRSVDVAGNVEAAKTARVKIDKTAPLAFALALPTLLFPANGRLFDITVWIASLDLLSGSTGLTLVSVTSSDPGVTPDDIAGWTIGTDDTRGQLRAERAAGGRTRTYRITYRGVDRAGNSALVTATAIVPGKSD
jgi:hypothetical protein